MMSSGIKLTPLAERVSGSIRILADKKNPVLREYCRVISNRSILGELTEEVRIASTDSLRDLAKGNRPVIKHLVTLHKLYRGDDPQLQSKEAKTAMQAILRVWNTEDPEAAHMFGRAVWEPDALMWMSFFDEVGSQPLGKALGMSGTSDIPDVPGSEYETKPSDIPEMPEYNNDDEEPESEAYDAASFLQ